MKSFFRSLLVASSLAACAIGTAILPVAALTLVAVPLTGCTPSVAQIKADGAAVATALYAVANIEAVTNPDAAANLRTAADGIRAATANYTSNSPTDIINASAAAAEAIMAGIDPGSNIAPLIAIAVTAIDLLLASIPPPTPPPAGALTAKAVKPNPYKGKAVIHHRAGRSLEGDLKAAWNAEVAKNPALASAALK